jgi:hypothetical protein
LSDREQLLLTFSFIKSTALVIFFCLFIDLSVTLLFDIGLESTWWGRIIEDVTLQIRIRSKDVFLLVRSKPILMLVFRYGWLNSNSMTANLPILINDNNATYLLTLTGRRTAAPSHFYSVLRSNAGNGTSDKEEAQKVKPDMHRWCSSPEGIPAMTPSVCGSKYC